MTRCIGREWYRAVSRMQKNALITYKAYEQNKELVQHDIDSKVPLLREIYKRYQNRCQQAGAMDFDDLLLQTNILFRDHPDVLEKYQEPFFSLAGGRVSGYEFCPASDCTALVRSTPTYLRGRR